MAEELLINAAVLTVAVLLLWRVAARIGDASFIDAVWGGGMAALALVALVQVPHPGPRAWALAAMTTLWGTRLGWHLFTRWRAQGEDPRYARMLGKAKRKGQFAAAALKVVFGPQAVLLFITCSPAQVGILASSSSVGGNASSIGLLALAGIVLWAIGITFETVGDRQLARFRADPANAGRVLDSGLWRYTRHPNYFGDTCVWWGIWLVAAECGWPVALGTLIGPVFLTFTLTRWSGKPLLEKGLVHSRPGYTEYVRRTSGFIPWIPRR